MVYCGKPSKGCKSCRERKIRCDTTEPACGQCMRANKECPGYRNQLDLSFRNESTSVIRKAMAKAKTRCPRSKNTSCEQGGSQSTTAGNDRYNCLTKRGASNNFPPKTHEIPHITPNTDAFEPIAIPDWVAQNYSTVASSTFNYSIHPTSEELGINCFVTNYVVRASGPSRGCFSFLPDFCQQDGIENTLKSSMTAVGLAGFANITRNSQLLWEARREYTTAIRSINEALSRPEDTVKNSTLLSILIISLFESITGHSQHSLRIWNEHIIGAATILKLRGRSQLKTEAGHTLFMHVASTLLISCVAREIPMPPQLLELRQEAFRMVTPDPAYKYLEVMDKFTILRSVFKNRRLTDLETILTTALKYDNDLMKIFSDVPDGWGYETIHDDPNCEFAYNGSYDIYYDLWITQIWNSMRQCRLMLNDIIRTCISEGFNSVPPTFTETDCATIFQHSTDVMLEMIRGVLRSVPQNIGYSMRRPFNKIQQPITDDLENISFTDLLDNESLECTSTGSAPTTPALTPARALGGYLLLWPLYVCGISRLSSPETREIVTTRLRYVGEEMGIMQANIHMNYLKAGAVFGVKNSLREEMLKTLEREQCILE